ncbi:MULTISPECIES: MSMEG_0570 family nitrogen starvation response protein [Pandoraea]|uniref:MSMEG_0570 family nitrogen starvation response protein n=1 Tax=Pandoraea TaxID=93217 RepID=UPI001F5DF54C|nr:MULTISPECIES: MSMEG_0570 family nitrogen starvation response protein [Pandoraea]MCI3206371.1 MSMEG_0570 family nitrogen starvation response protein [Pandoraea sp. LA3]MDN4584399.1 MSMEG_0570 family nitrogen starvation response protein [Pandoraea capi]
MPVTYFTIKWPDDVEMRCYSPSSVVRDFLRPGEYPLDDFLDAADRALAEASNRVREKFGYACSSARDQWETIEQTARKYRSLKAPRVTVISVGNGVGSAA